MPLRLVFAFVRRQYDWLRNASPVWHVVIPTVGLACIGIIFVATYLPGAMQSAAIDAAYRANVEVADQIKITRGYYTRAVVAKAIETGALRPDVKHEDDPTAIPLPATFVNDISDLLRAKDTTLSLVSPYPWPHRADRKMDDFQSQAWQSFQLDPSSTFSRLESRDGRRVLRVAVADRMTGPACVTCHNSHPQSVKRDWKLDDVRAVMEVTKVVEPYLAAAEQRSSRIVATLAVVGGTISALLFAFASLIARRTREKQQADARLLEAFDIVPQGLVLFDAEDRFLLWNRQFTELYPATADLIAKGVRFEDVLRGALARGVHPEAEGREEEWIAERLRRHKNSRDSHEQQLPNGRWVRVEERRTSDGGSIGSRVDITELKQREASFRFLFESNPVPMWIFDATNLKFLAVNDAAVALYGFSRDQFLGMSVLDVRPSEDREEFAKFVADSQSSQGKTTRRHVRSNGSAMHVAVYSRSMNYEGHAAYLSAIVDITDRKRADDDLRRAQYLLGAVVENVPATLVVTNVEDRRFVLINRAGEKFFGRSRDKMVGKTGHEFFPEEQVEQFARRDREVVRTGEDSDFQDHWVDTPSGKRLVRSKRILIKSEAGKPQYILGISEDITDKKKAEERIAYLAHHDSLTDLPNRASFKERFASVLQRAAATRSSFAILSIDLDRFKEVNDVFGHFTGDALLRQAAQRLQSAAQGEFVARLGGDEFTIIAESEQPSAIWGLAERLLRSAGGTFNIEGRQLHTGLSIGIAVYPTDGTDAATLLSNADAALYRAKTDGRGTIRFFEAEMDKRLRARRTLQRELETTIERGALTLHYQPQAKIDGEIVGLEALLRWQHPVQGLLLPSSFISIAEESGLILPAGEWVLREACREAASWPNPIQIAVNLSPVQFQHGDLPALVCEILLETGLAPRRLELEITESTLIGDFSRALSILRRLKAIGVQISMDDFGTGYSSLSYLQSFPFDKIKIDQSFIANVKRNPQSTEIVRAVIGLCRGLNLTVVAEGVENSEQLAVLAREKCNQVQGYLIGKPGPIEQYASVVGRPAAAESTSLTA